FERRIAHQVDAVRVRPRAPPHATGIDDGHEDQADRFELALQQAVPGQAPDQAAQIGQNDGATDPFEAMEAAEKTDDGDAGIRIAQGHDMHREAVRPDAHLAGDPGFELTPAIANNGFQFEQFGEFGVSHAGQLRIALKMTERLEWSSEAPR